jgi:hypothetical protein
MKPRAVGCESRAGRPLHTKGSTDNDDGEDNNVDDTVGEDCEDFDEEDGDPDPIPQRVGAKRSKSSLEWNYFHAVGQWKNKSYRAAACVFCMQEWKRLNNNSDFPQQNLIRSKPETMSIHIRTCLNVPTGQRREYSQDTDAFYNTSRMRKTCKSQSLAKTNTLTRYVHKTLTNKSRTSLHDQVRDMLIDANIPFHAVDRPLFRKLLTDICPSIDLPFSNKMSSVVLARRAAYYATVMKTKNGGNGIFCRLCN